MNTETKLIFTANQVHDFVSVPFHGLKNRPRGYKTFFMQNSAETKIYPAHVKMPLIVSILTFISRINHRLWQSKPEISSKFGYFSNYEHFKFHAQLS